MTDRMSDAEAIMWAVEKDPALRSDFCNLTLLDCRPTDERLEATLTRALRAIPRLRQRVVSAPLRVLPPEFADDPTLDVEAHIRVLALPAPYDERALLDLCGRLAEQPLDRARPLWEFTLIEGLRDGRSALLQKVHHTITDGVGGLKLSLALVDFEREPSGVAEEDEPPAANGTATPVAVARNAVVGVAERGIGAVGMMMGAAGNVFTHPTKVPRRASEAVRLVSSLRRQTLVAEPARSDLFTGRSLRRYFTTARLPLARMRAAAERLGGSVNDVFVTGLASALGRYHEAHGSTVDELRLAMPVSTRVRGDVASANRFAPARVLVPIQPAHDPTTLFADIHERLEVAKHESALAAVEGLTGLVSGLPTSMLVAFTRTQTRTIDFAASNLRGSAVPLYLSGAQILSSYPFGPRTGTALNVTLLSYVDEALLGFNIDPAAITDPSAFMRDVGDAFADIIAES